MPKGDLLKRWNDWSAGVGHLVDDGRTPGMYSASGLLGLQGELRPAPFFNSVTVDIPAAHHFQYYLEEPATATETPAFDAQGPDSDGENIDGVTMSWTHTIGTNLQRLLVVCVAFDGNGGGGMGATSVKFAGTNLTLLESKSTTEVRTEIWYLVAPDSGAGTVTVNTLVTNEMIGGSTSWSAVDQSSPFGDAEVATGTSTSPSVTVTTTSGQQIVSSLGSEGGNTSTVGTNETEQWDGQAGAPDVSGACYTQAGSDGGVINPTLSGSVKWVMVAVPIIGPPTSNVSFLYAMRGRRVTGDTVKLHKIELTNENFGVVQTSSGDDFHDLTPLETPGQPARYQGKWYLPGGNDNVARELTTIGTGSDSIDNDTLTGTATGHEEGADHLANLNSQLVGIVEHNSTNEGGVRILKVNGGVVTEADWGPEFQVGDKNERAAGLRALKGLIFVMNVEGIFSFDKESRARLVFEDFRIWRNTFKNIAIMPWNGGLIMPHPTGLLFFNPGELPFNIGIDALPGTRTMPVSGPTELHGGLYHGVHTAGENIYALYQPDLTATSVLVTVGYLSGDNMVWQVLGSTTLQDLNHMLGVFVALQGRPLASTHVTPTTWFGNGDDLNYVVLDPRATPFRARADTHKVNILADAYMSELRFTEPVDLTDLIIHTSADMVAGDEWQISLLTNGTGDDIYVGPPIRGAAARHPRTIDRAKGGKNVTSLVLHVEWVATSTADRVPPVIQAIELYGLPSVGEVEDQR